MPDPAHANTLTSTDTVRVEYHALDRHPDDTVTIHRAVIRKDRPGQVAEILWMGPVATLTRNQARIIAQDLVVFLSTIPEGSATGA